MVCWRRAKQEEGWTFISTMGHPAFRRDCYICDLGDFLYCVRNKKPSLVCLGVQRIRMVKMMNSVGLYVMMVLIAGKGDGEVEQAQRNFGRFYANFWRLR